MHSPRERGFTLIELLVVAVIVGILATVVAMTYSGVQAKNRNRYRKDSIDALQHQLETYYAVKSQYPSLAQLNSPNWRQENLKNMPENLIRDPQWNDTVSACTVAKRPVLASRPAAKCYAYQATATDGSPCVDEKVACIQYSLTAIFEGGEKYVKTSIN